MNVSKKEIILVVAVLLLGGWYVYAFTDWFRPKFIRVEYTVRPLREAWSGNGKRADTSGKNANNVTFALHKDYRLTSVRVVSRSDFETNKYAHPLWSLASSSGSAPVNSISYGMPIDGMTPSPLNPEAEPLQAGVEYRLLIEAHSLRGTNDFNIPMRSASR